ncbi:hypothetical protein RchiOBHm_Chr2g0130071 [Rosa chinensis]|uniref:Uncharacterized protein n=1 Tax=Rosa chinensis TaxID=74649 RepID=A0A2P6RUR2_ROSCH|nr:hypothetical protein RchiOBHm_Chr2g0130071 [Rosa chinensis]
MPLSSISLPPSLSPSLSYRSWVEKVSQRPWLANFPAASSFGSYSRLGAEMVSLRRRTRSRFVPVLRRL